MRIVILPPYQNRLGFVIKQTRELMEHMEKKGQIRREEYIIDEGYFIDWTDQRRDSEFLAQISLGIIKKVKEYSRMKGVNAIVCQGSMEPAFFPAREISDLPYMGSLHAALHVASLLGDRCSIIDATDTQAVLVRRQAKVYGFNEKLVSIRCPSYSSTQMGMLVDEQPKEARANAFKVQACVDDIVNECIAAVELDRADSVILSCTPLQVFEEEIRRGLDEAGYRDVPLICELSAAVAMAQAIVGMGLTHARMAYPRADTVLKPTFR